MSPILNNERSASQLEALVWHELDTVATLAARLHRGQRMLPDTFASYRPPPSG